MPEENHGPSDKDLAIAKQKGYQDSDISLTTIAQWAIALTIFVVASAGVALIILKFVQSPLITTPEPASTALPHDERRGLASNIPLIQEAPIPQIKDYRGKEEAKLIEYAKVDGKNRIPLDRAIEIAIKKGLPVQTSGEAATGMPLTAEMKAKPVH